MMVIIHHKSRLYGFTPPPQLQKLPSAGALWIFVNMQMPLLSRHSIAVKSALVLTRMSPLFSFDVFGASIVACLSCSAWQCYNSKSVSWSSHQIIQGKKRNCPCIICGHILLSSLSGLLLSHGLLSCAVPCTVNPSPGILSCHPCIQSTIRFENFDSETLAFLWYVLFENHPSLKGNNNLINSQIFGRVVKFGKCSIQNIKQVSYLP